MHLTSGHHPISVRDGTSNSRMEHCHIDTFILEWHIAKHQLVNGTGPRPR
jgi:hypothetical protein